VKRFNRRSADSAKKQNNRHRPSRTNSRRLTFEQLSARRVLAVVFGDFNGDG
jgi:hypothetical protein